MKADTNVVLIYFRLQQSAIFDFPFILTSDNVVTSPGEFFDPSRWNFELRYALYHIYFRLKAAIFDSPLIHTSGNLGNSLVV